MVQFTGEKNEMMKSGKFAAVFAAFALGLGSAVHAAPPPQQQTVAAATGSRCPRTRRGGLGAGRGGQAFGAEREEICGPFLLDDQQAGNRKFRRCRKAREGV